MRHAGLAVGILLALMGVSCDPPGKPKGGEPLPDQITDFNVLFSNNCSGCHGVNGKNGPGRPLNDPLYLALIPKDVLQQTIENGRPGTAMPPWAHSQGGPLTPKQISVVVDGIERWAKPVDLHGASLPPYSGGDKTGDANQGKKLFAKDCFMCHGPGAAIGPITNTAYLQLVSDQMLRASIITGRPDLGMPDFRALNLGKALSDQDVTDLVAYLTSLRPANAMPENVHVQENGTGEAGQMTRGNEGSGNGPGSSRREKNEGNKSTGASSQGGPK